MPICLGCGVIAPERGTECEVCRLNLPTTDRRARAPRLIGDRFWVAVRCQFQCRVCGHLSPLDFLDADGSVDCMSCGVAQAFDVTAWTDGLAHAHAVGDLSGPEPEGRFPDPSIAIAGRNPFARIGIDATRAQVQLTGTTISGGMVIGRSLLVDASPGHPLCQLCRGLLTVERAHGGALSMRCQACQEDRQYRIADAAQAVSDGLLGAVADQHRADSRDARIDRSEGGALVIRCPNCAGAVSVSAASSAIDCQYCHVLLRIPNAAFQGLGRGVPEPLLWWLLFQGPSAQRAELLAGQSAGDDRQKVEKLAIEQAPQGRHGAFFELLGLVVPLAIFLAVGMTFFRAEIDALLARL